MVGFHAKEDYYKELVTGLSELRNDDSLCDVRLKVCGCSIPAHRCVLAAASTYFRSMFIGAFNETSAAEVDLSSVTDDSEAVQCVVNLIYTGDIDLSTDNIDDFVQLSSFFMLGRLENICVEFILQSHNLDNCLRYYFMIAGRGFTELESVLLSRFHDYLILQGETLNVSPVQLHALHSGNAFKFCRNPDIAHFLAKWVETGLTEEHFTAATEVLEVICVGLKKANQRLSSLNIEDIKRIHDRLRDSVSQITIEIRERFVCQLELILPEIFGACDGNIATTYTQELGQLGNGSIENELESVVVVFTPQSSVSRSLNAYVYSPPSRRWHDIHSFADTDTKEPALRRRLPSKCYCLEEWLVVLDGDHECFNSLDLNTMKWENMSFDSIFDALPDDDCQRCTDYALAFGKQTTEYLVAKVCEFSGPPRNPKEIYFVCFELDAEGDDSHRLLFKTPVVPANKAYTETLRAEYIASTDELIVVLTGVETASDFVAFVADMSMSPPVVCMLSQNETRSEELHIIQGHDRLYLVEDFPRMCPIFEYEFTSRALTVVTAAVVVTDCVEDNIQEMEISEASLALFPRKTTLSLSEADHMWRINCSADDRSSLPEI
ncbi:MAG: BTB/POZ domain-containing protein, partial [Sedimenticola sp.]